MHPAKPKTFTMRPFTKKKCASLQFRKPNKIFKKLSEFGVLLKNLQPHEAVINQTALKLSRDN